MVQLLGGGAGAHQGVEAGDGAAGDGDEQGGEQGAQAGHLVGKAGEGGHIHVGGVRAGEARADDAHGGDDHHAVEQEGAEVVTGLEQDPHRSYRGDEDVHADDPHPRGVGQVDGVEVQADDQADDDTHHAHNGGHRQGRAPAVDGQAEDNGHQDEQNGNHGHGGVGVVGGAVGVEAVEGAGHDGGEGGHHQHQGQVREDQEELLGPLADVDGHHLAQGLALVADGGEQGAVVMDGAEEDAADEHPQHHGHPAEDGRLNGAVNGAGAGDGGKVVSHQDRGFGRDVVHAILQLMSWSDLGVVHPPLLGKPAAVENVSHDQDGNANDDN